MIPIVLRTWALDLLKEPAFLKKSPTEVVFGERTYSFAAIYDEAGEDWHEPLKKNGTLVLIGPTGSGKTTTLRLLLEDFCSNDKPSITAFEVSRNNVVLDLLNNKAQKRYLNTLPIDTQLQSSPLTHELIEKLFRLRLTASTKANAMSSRSCMLVKLACQGKELNIVDMMGNERFEAGGTTSNAFANLNVSSITLAMLNRTSTKRSSNLITNLIFNGSILTLEIRFVLHLDQNGDKALIKSSFNNIADVVKGFKLEVDKTKPGQKKGTKLPLYARPTACSLSPKKKPIKRPLTAAAVNKPVKQPRLSLSTPSKPPIPRFETASRTTGLTQKLKHAQQEADKLKREQEMKTLKDEILVLQGEVKKARLATVPLKELIGYFKEAFEGVDNEMKTLHSRKEEVEHELLQKETEISKLKNSLKEAETKFDMLKGELETAKAEFTATTEENEKLQAKIQEQLTILSQKGDDLSKQLEEKASLNESLTKQLEEKESLNDTLSKQLEEANGKFSNKNSEYAKLEEELNHVKAELTQQSHQHEIKNKELDSLVSLLRGDIKQLEKDVKNAGLENSLVLKKKEDEIAKLQQKVKEQTEKASLEASNYQLLKAQNDALEAQLTTEATKYLNLQLQLKKQEELSKQTHSFLQEKIKNMTEENERLLTDLTRFKSKGIQWKKRNEVLARENNIIEASEYKQRAKVAELEETVEELQKYKTKCEYLDSNLLDLRTLSQSEELKLRQELNDYKEKYRKLLNELSFSKPLLLSDIYEDTTFKTYLKHKKREQEPKSSPLKERNVSDRKHKKRHSLTVPLKVQT